MVKIRLSRTGRKNLPSYRVVVTPLREKRDSKVIEHVGHYSPITKEFVIDKERVQYWLSVGAQPTDTVKRQFIKLGLLKKEEKAKKFNRPAKKKSVERKQAKEEAKAKASEASE